MTDLEDLMRSHLDDALGGAGKGLPSNAAPALFRTARRRTQRRRVAAGAGGLAVVAVAAVLISGSVGQKGASPDRIIPATEVPTVAASATPVGTPPTPVALSAGPVVSGPNGSSVYLSPLQHDATRVYVVKAKGSTPGSVLSLNLATNQITTVATGITAAMGQGADVADGKAWVIERAGSKLQLSEFDATTGAHLKDIPLPGPGDADCGTSACLEPSMTDTYVAVAGSHVVVVGLANETTSAVVTVDASTGAILHRSTSDQRPLQPETVYDGRLYLFSEGHTLQLAQDGTLRSFANAFQAGVQVDADGIYVFSESDTGGANTAAPTTFTFSRVDPVTLQVTKKVTITRPALGNVPAAEAGKDASTITVVGGHLYYTDATCSPNGPAATACVDELDPQTLTSVGTALRVSDANGSATLADGLISVDGQERLLSPAKG